MSELISQEMRYRQKTIMKTSHLQYLTSETDDLLRVLVTYPVNISEIQSNSKYPKGYTEFKLEFVSIHNLKDIKHAVVSFDMHHHM